MTFYDIYDVCRIMTFEEELIWSGPGGWIVLRQVAGIHCVNYIGEKDCTARFATWAIWEIPDWKLNQVAPATQAGLYRRGSLYVVYFLYGGDSWVNWRGDRGDVNGHKIKFRTWFFFHSRNVIVKMSTNYFLHQAIIQLEMQWK